MLRTKVYESYYPYIDGHNGQGKEYCFDETEEEVIDYNDYYHSSFDLFWEKLQERYRLLEPSFTEFIFTKEEIQTILINTYKVQEGKKNINPYYFYIDLNGDEFLTEAEKKFSSSKMKILKFLVNQNLYIEEFWAPAENLYNGSNLIEGIWYEKIEVLQNGKRIEIYKFKEKFIKQEDDPENNDIGKRFYKRVIDETPKLLDSTDVDYKNVGFYMGVDVFKDITSTSGENVNNEDLTEVQKFHYYEFKMTKKRIQHKIISLRIDAPIGTSFYLNRSLHPLTIYKYANPFILDNLKGYYEIQPEDYVTLKYLTFPKDAIIQYEQVLNENYDPTNPNTRTRPSDDDDFYWTVSYLYNDDYDVEYKEE